MSRLDGKIALVTGGASGMGVTHVRLLAAEGAKVMIADIDREGGEKLAAEFGAEVAFTHLDVTSEESWKAAVAATREQFGTVTVLVNNAGISGGAGVTADMDLNTYYRTIDVDQHGTMLGMRATIPAMVEAGGGSIVNISSLAGMTAAVGFPNIAYVAAKFAVRGMTKAAAMEYAAQNVRVNSVHPGTVTTPLTEDMLTQYGEEFRRSYTDKIPMKRLATPEEISHAVVFLASDESGYMTGTEIVIDGGQLAEQLARPALPTAKRPS
ncbi:SDR family NAD(P)-dependent oxidoreductase [Ruania zhangjianzhongii]|uniref:SDR family NAD(P)-dependent oxidoreductase n=1 Tax=Ruania zhangjianzhongii TaxID=2603206 RepID=UPI0011C8D127|nr:glucose 1-dehydrogenase [Ruania zhangjianzhongii]